MSAAMRSFKSPEDEARGWALDFAYQHAGAAHIARLWMHEAVKACAFTQSNAERVRLLEAATNHARTLAREEKAAERCHRIAAGERAFGGAR